MEKGTFYRKIANFCKDRNMKCTISPSDKGDWQLRVEYKFLNDCMLVHRAEIVHIKERGSVANYWWHTIHDGRHHISGPGYPAHALFEQKPIPLDRICAMFLNGLLKSYKYYQPR